jgi:hypothetical protein
MHAKRLLRVTAASLAAFLFALPLSQSLDAQSGASTAGANPTEGVSRSASELQALVAPIALYPDSLVAQILSGATFPDEIAVADYWLQQNKSLTGNALMHAVDGQSWDASVKALTQFPSVLDNMAKNLAWTSSLGEAFHDQRSEVMTAIQTLRAQAKTQGALKSSSQITVTQQSPEVIVIQPANPQIVYVPQYNPTVVYGTPYVVPNYIAPSYSAGDVAAAGILGFGAGIAVGAMMSGGCCSWGYSSWNCGWHGTAVVYHGGAYYGNAGWHGGYYNGGYRGYNNSFNHTNYNSNAFNRNISGNTVNINKPSSQALDQDRTNFDQAHPQASQQFTQDRSSFDANHPSDASSWAQRDSGTHSDAFSGMSGHSGGFGDSGGWASRADSSRGWDSMRSSGFGGGRFGGGGGFGGGRFGGFRR